MRILLVAVGLSAVLVAVQPAFSQDLVYSPVNPSFGGNPLYSSYLMATAGAQREATASDADDDEEDVANPGTGGGGTGTNDVDLFIRQLQGRLLSALATQVTEAIFGENPQDSGTIQFGGTTVEFERTADAISLRITGEDGTVTVITVPQLVTSADAASFAAPASGLSTSGLTSGSLSGGRTGALSQGSLSQTLTQSLD